MIDFESIIERLNGTSPPAEVSDWNATCVTRTGIRKCFLSLVDAGATRKDDSLLVAEEERDSRVQ